MTVRRLCLALWLVPAAAMAAGPIKLKPAPREIEPQPRSGPAAVRPPPPDELAVEIATERKRDQLIEELQAILPRISEGERKADLTFQLAELWWEKARFQSMREVKEYDEAQAKWSAERKGEEPRIDDRRSAGYRQEALQLYQEILERHPAYARTDEVLFVVGYNLAESGRKQEAVRRYQELIDRHPRSRFVPDAWVQMGEQSFANNDLAHARAAYEKAAAYRLPKLYPFAIYKLAWCDYNAGDHRAAIARFQEVVSYADAQAGSQGASDRVQLRNEALRDIILSYARLDAIDEAAAYLKAKGGERAIELLNRLAATCFDSGKFEAAIRVYRMLQADDPRNLRAPSWQQRILLANDKLNRRDQVVSEIHRLVAEYGPRGAWAQANAGQKGALAEADDLAESALRELVQDYHHEAIKTKSAATYRLARDIYRQYLETFPRSEAAYSMRFFYAEILYSLEQWDDAAAQYEQVAGADPRGMYAQKAAYDAILALEKSVSISRGKRTKRELADAARVDERKAKGAVERDRALPRQAAGKDLQPEPIPGNEQKLVAACERYLRLAPGAKDEIAIRYKAAFVFYDHRHFVEAAKRFGDIILRWPTDPWSQKAAELSLDILNTKEEWAALSDLAHRFLQNRQLAPQGGKFAKEAARIGEGARFKAVMQIYEQKKDPALAAREFRAFVAEYPKSQYAPRALYNALVIADQADQLDLEIAAGEELLREHPEAEAELMKLALPALASACERSGRFRDAVRYFEQSFSRWPSDARAADWLYEAALQREASGEDDRAAAAWQRYLTGFGTRPDAARVAFDLGLLFERQKQWKRAADHWAGFARKWEKSATPAQLLLARYRHGLALRELKSAQAAQALAEIPQRYARLPQDARASPALIDAAAHARFLAVDQAFNEFLAIHFKYTRQRDLVHVLKVKNARLGALLSSYAEVIAIGSPRWSEAAFERIGEAYRNFNKGLLEAPMPRGLDPEQQDLYRSTLESQALPLEDKAVEAFRRAISVAEKSGVYTDSQLKAQDFLREYQPDAFGEVHKAALAEGERLRRTAPAVTDPGAAPGSGRGGGR